MLSKGLRFHTKSEVKDAVIRISVANHTECEVVESDKITLAYRCHLHKTSGCRWRLRAPMMQKYGKFEITKYEGPHTCTHPTMSRDHLQLSGDFLTDIVLPIIRVDPSVKVVVLIETICKETGYSVSYTKAWNAKKKAIARQFGEWDSSYNFLPQFMEALQRYNEGTVVDLQPYPIPGDKTIVFGQIFWAFKVCREGFHHCRPVVSIDGTHLYGKYSEKMLVAMSLDANNQIFPLAFAICDVENEDNWYWFLYKLKIEVLGDRDGICLISDRHSGISSALNAQNEEFSWWTEPKGYHRYCLCHVRSNFNEYFKDGHLKRLLWVAGSTPQVRKFDKAMARIKEINEDAFNYLDEIPVEKWTLAHDGGHRYGQVTTNISEVFNSAIKGARSLPITASVERIFFKLVKYFVRGYCRDGKP